MADRRVKLILEAQVDQFNSNLRKARDEADGLGKKLRTAINQPEMQQLGRHLTVFGTATVGALGLATKAAMDWESSWTDVMRRTEGTPQQLAALEDSLRGVARELPTTHQEVAAVAAAAAQLGVGIDDVEQFTRVMIDMGVATNMTADQAATSMARFANIMGTPVPEMDRLGSAIVDLGNNSATTESEIMDMALRLAGAGRQAGLSEGDIMGFAAAMSSLGLEAQAGGTALSRTMVTIGLEVDRNGDKLGEFARVAGMSAEEFSQAWGEDAAGALLMFIEGLSQSEARGESMNSVLADLGITAIRESDALRRLASGVDLTSDSIERGNNAWAENTAMVTEAGYVYETAESRITAAWAMIYDAAIDVGAVLVPIVASLAEGAGTLAQAFAQIPEPAQRALVLLAGLIGVGSLAAGSFILLAPGIFATADALRSMGVTGTRARGIMGGLARGAGVAAVAFVGFEIALAGARLLVADFEHTVTDAARAMEAGTAGAVAFEGNVGGLGRGFDNLGEAIARATDHNPVDKFSLWGAESFNLQNSLTNARDAVSSFDQALAQMIAKGELEAAADGFRQIIDEAHEAGVSTTTTADQFKQLDAALYDAGISMDEFLVAIGASGVVFDEAQGKYVNAEITLSDLASRMNQTEQDALAAALGVEDLDEAMGGLADEATSAADAMRGLVDQLVEAGAINRDARAAARDYEDALRSLTDSIAENGQTLDITTAAGTRNEAALDAIADAGVRSMQAMADNSASQEELQAQLSRTYDDLVSAAGQFGVTGDQAAELAREVLGIPDGVSIESWMSTEAEETAKRLNSELDRADGRHTRSNHTHTITERTLRVAANTGASANRPAGYATGGAVRGPGGPTSDSILARLSNGEHVIPAHEVQKMGGQEGVYQIRRQLTGQTPQRPSGSDMIPAYATGGAVTRRGSGAVDQESLVTAITAAMGRPVQFNFETHNAVAEPQSKTVARSLEAIGVGYNPDEFGG